MNQNGNGAAMANGSVNGNNINPMRRGNLMTIANDPGKSTAVKLLHRRENEVEKEAMGAKRMVHQGKKEMYYTVNLYLLMQGVLYSGVAQTTIFNCGDLWGPITISALITFGSVIVFINRFKKYKEYERIERSLALEKVKIYHAIHPLIHYGDGSSIHKGLSTTHSLRQQHSPNQAANNYTRLSIITVVLRRLQSAFILEGARCGENWYSDGIVLVCAILFFSGFGVIVMYSFFMMLCSPAAVGRCSPPVS